LSEDENAKAESTKGKYTKPKSKKRKYTKKKPNSALNAIKEQEDDYTIFRIKNKPPNIEIKNVYIYVI